MAMKMPTRSATTAIQFQPPRVAVLAVRPVEVGERASFRAADPPVVGDEDARDGAGGAAVGARAR